MRLTYTIYNNILIVITSHDYIFICTNRDMLLKLFIFLNHFKGAPPRILALN